MDYKNIAAASQFFLTDEDNVQPKSIFFDIDKLKRNGNLNATYDYILKDWINDYIALLPITTPIFFDLIQNGRKHSYKATPEKLNTIIQCLKTYNFDEVLSETPISSDPPFSPEFVNVSGFGIRTYPALSERRAARSAGRRRRTGWCGECCRPPAR